MGFDQLGVTVYDPCSCAIIRMKSPNMPKCLDFGYTVTKKNDEPEVSLEWKNTQYFLPILLTVSHTQFYNNVPYDHKPTHSRAVL